jgi:hypothetical protein
MVAGRLGQCGSMLLGRSRNQLAQARGWGYLWRAWGAARCEFLRRLEGFEMRCRPQRVEVDPVIKRQRMRQGVSGFLCVRLLNPSLNREAAW